MSGAEAGPAPEHDSVLFSTFEAGATYRIVRTWAGAHRLEIDRASQVAWMFAQDVPTAFEFMKKDIVAHPPPRKQDWSPRSPLF